MNQREAMRRICHGAAELLDNGSANLWLSEGLSDADAKRMQDAFAVLCAELWRRGGVTKAVPNPRGTP